MVTFDLVDLMKATAWATSKTNPCPNYGKKCKTLNSPKNFVTAETSKANVAFVNTGKSVEDAEPAQKYTPAICSNQTQHVHIYPKYYEKKMRVK